MRATFRTAIRHVVLMRLFRSKSTQWDAKFGHGWQRIPSLAVAVLAVTVQFAAVDAAAQDLEGLNYRIRTPVIAASGGAGQAADSGGLYLVGANVGGQVASVSVGEETGVRLYGGLWPAMVGAAFDQDRDLVPNVTDNCTVIRNTLQLDVDGDSYGNACDADLNNDGVVNFADLAQLKRAFFTDDPLADLNADGVVNFADLAIMKKSFFKKPGPAAGKP